MATVTVTPVQPSENSVVSVSQVMVQVKAVTDLAGGSVTSGTITVNNGTPLTMAFDSALGVWKAQVSVALGPVICKIDMVDSGSTHGILYIAFSRAASTNPIAAIAISHPTEGVTVHSPGVILQADISRTTDIARVEASVDNGVSWVPMTFPISSGGS